MIEQLQLQKIDDLTKSSALMIDANNHKYIKINHPHFDAAFALHGAHLLHFQMKQQAPLIYLSKTAVFNGQKAIRGGVPICWPWFGSAVEALGENLPAHGFARTSTWSLSSINENSTSVEVEFSLEQTKATKQIWDHPFSLTLKATLSDQIKLSLTTTNTGTKALCYGGALHTYLFIGDAKQTCVRGLATNYADSLDNATIKHNKQALTVNKPIDSIYQTNQGKIVVDDVINKREINIINKENDSVVVWNPWIEGAKAFNDLPDDGYKNMLCIESAITSNKGKLIQPGQSHTLITIIK